MKLIDIYIGRCIVQQSLLVIAVLAGIFAFLNFIDQLADLGSGSYGLLDVLRFVVLTTPRIIHDTFPMASLVGAILGLSVLARHSELTVMRARAPTAPIHTAWRLYFIARIAAMKKVLSPGCW